MRLQEPMWVLPPIESDVVYTPTYIAQDMIDWCKPDSFCLDPCMGEGAFYSALQEPKDWCEIEKGRDFFRYEKKCEWIIGNPPYSIFEDWLAHSFELADNVVYLLPTNKVFQRVKIMRMINTYGGIYGMRVYGSGTNAGLPFGFSVGAFHFQRDWHGKTDISLCKELEK